MERKIMKRTSSIMLPDDLINNIFEYLSFEKVSQIMFLNKSIYKKAINNSNILMNCEIEYKDFITLSEHDKKHVSH